jgi:hypothetical protein
VIDVAPTDVGNQMRCLKAEVVNAAVQLVRHFLRTAGRRHGHGQKDILVARDQVFDPVVVGLRAGQPQTTDVFRSDVDARGKENLFLDTFLFNIVCPEVHVIAGDLPRGDFAVSPVDFGIVDIRMTVRRATLRVAGIQRMNPLGVMVSAFAGLLWREPRMGFGQIINFVHEVALTQMRIQVDDHSAPPSYTFVLY